MVGQVKHTSEIFKRMFEHVKFAKPKPKQEQMLGLLG
jgi:hypothetical protein